MGEEKEAEKGAEKTKPGEPEVERRGQGGCYYKEMQLCGRSQTKEPQQKHPDRGPCSTPREAGVQALTFPFPRECGPAAGAKSYVE